jgi:tRNA C32,U32 (ribose-2'-O)-methylase TrmJ
MYVRQDWEIEQYLADKEREKQDAIDMKKKKEFVGSSEKEIEISYKKFEEKLQQVKIVPFEEVKESMRKFEQRFERDVMESRFEEIFDEEITEEDENGTRDVMNREEFCKYRWNEGAMWPPLNSNY